MGHAPASVSRPIRFLATIFFMSAAVGTHTYATWYSEYSCADYFCRFANFPITVSKNLLNFRILYLKHGSHPNRSVSPRDLSREDIFMRICGRASYVLDLYLRIFTRGLLPPLREFPRNECERQCATLMLCFTALPQRRHRSASAARRTRLAPSASRHGLALAGSG